MRNRFTRRCDHKEAVVTVVAGIERTVCASCGYVTIGFDHRTCIIWPDEWVSADQHSEPNAIAVTASSIGA